MTVISLIDTTIQNRKVKYFVIKLYTNLLCDKSSEATTKYQAMAISSFQQKFQNKPYPDPGLKMLWLGRIDNRGNELISESLSRTANLIRDSQIFQVW